ncbi:hypothetical protein DL346_02725 [Paenibacillus montanisoli]|uniref:Uncharacterized protein n=2 Tax=Paenibacillus montanisoli TaxID=2081970 RepID=A0A328UAW0_9BACL|nr:hypothetical protein DL346_02725 [Paenibacillus montanisoli]
MELGSYTTAFNFGVFEKQIGGNKVDWGVVTAPVGSLNRDYSDYYKINEIYGISSHSAHKDEAWKFIEFIVGNENFYLQNGDDLLNYGIPTHSELLPQIDGHDLSPLYNKKSTQISNNPYDQIDFNIINAFKIVGQKYMDKVVNGEMDITSAFEKIELEGQQAVNAEAKKLKNVSEEWEMSGNK